MNLKPRQRSLILGVGAGILAFNQLMIQFSTPPSFLAKQVGPISLLTIAAFATAIGLYWLKDQKVA